MSRDRLGCGVRNDRIQQRLLAEATLTLEEDVKIAAAIERAEENLKKLQVAREVPEVNALKLTQNSRTNSKTSCDRCGKTNHNSHNCRFKNAKCYRCHKWGISYPAPCAPRRRKGGRNPEKC